jgi:hypothetical protein
MQAMGIMSAPGETAADDGDGGDGNGERRKDGTAKEGDRPPGHQ